ncbi:hypothetical protein CLI92_00155 [Vandammella animalimorsus]|uniref:Uncharacterized protein n=1 Tax=Vandammella animalimorsus TaxID=2029117 RepID=A0A2A2T882_9BURK|nr:helix-turn-helix domain-containing protein [Vandammella animalimorsus]PAT30970.1 hypothetical protein CK626_12415 [Vandammella animalimorsus]PAX18304.1 hypothetical protein CLI92_00155 [Vandammella animalimorsus]PAX20467.1 hypothetical protein CLI93_01575 [Vandammella animalimorsus]
MEMIDMRRLTPEARQKRRRQVIKLRRQGWTYEAIGTELSLSRTDVFEICKRYEEEGSKALADRLSNRTVSNMQPDRFIGSSCFFRINNLRQRMSHAHPTTTMYLPLPSLRLEQNRQTLKRCLGQRCRLF